MSRTVTEAVLGVPELELLFTILFTGAFTIDGAAGGAVTGVGVLPAASNVVPVVLLCGAADGCWEGIRNALRISASLGVATVALAGAGAAVAGRGVGAAAGAGRGVGAAAGAGVDVAFGAGVGAGAGAVWLAF